MHEIQTMIDIGVHQQKNQKGSRSMINLRLTDNQVKTDKKEDDQSYEHINQEIIVQKSE